MGNAKKKAEKKCPSTGCVRGAGHDGMHGTTKLVPTAEAVALETADDARRAIASIGAVLGVGAAAGDVQSFEAGVRRGREEIIARIREQARRTQRPGFTWNDLADALERELRVLA